MVKTISVSVFQQSLVAMVLRKSLKLELNADEKALFVASADAVRKTNDVLKEINVL